MSEDAHGPLAGLRFNPAIPNTMRPEGLVFLATLARLLPEDATIVEAGALYGATAWAMSQNAPASARIHSIDPWDAQAWLSDPWVRDEWMPAQRKADPQFPDLSKAAFLTNVADCPNVTAHQGFAPQDAPETGPIDLFFEDADHVNPTFDANMDHFTKALRPGGILCGDDYWDTWPAVWGGVRRVAAAWNTTAIVRGLVWAMVKPRFDGDDILSRLEAGLGADLRVELMRADGSTTVTGFFGWSLRVIDDAPVIAMVIRPRGTAAAGGAVTVYDLDGRACGGGAFGEVIALPDHPIGSLRVRDALGGSPRDDLIFQTAARTTDGALKLSKHRLFGETAALGRDGGRLVDIRMSANKAIIQSLASQA